MRSCASSSAKLEHRRDAARRDHDFLAFLQAWLHGRVKIGRDHRRDLMGDGQGCEAGALVRVGAQGEADAEHAHDEKKRVRFRVRQGQFDGKQNRRM